MRLDALSVEGFRAVRTARVRFDETTVLIGESESARSSLLGALDVALRPTPDGGPTRFPAAQFHRSGEADRGAPADAVRIALEFRERRPDEWAPLAGSPLDPLLGTAASTRRAFALEVVAMRPPGGADAVAEWRLRALGAAEDGPALRDPAAIAFVRRMSPLVRLRRGAIGAPAFDPNDGSRLAALPPEVARLVARIQGSHAAILSGAATDERAVLADGFDAARTFLSTASHHLGANAHPFRAMVAEILARGRELPAQLPSPPPRRELAVSEQVGVLALLGALLRELPAGLADGAEPIWLVEDPEAHLHPVTLAAVIEMIGNVRWQTIITTRSGDVLAAEPLRSLRRLTSLDGEVREWSVRPRGLSGEDLRRVSYHLRARRGVATFSRCWLLVEGETEFWVLPELARVAGYDFAREGVACVEFAQCGLSPLLKLARELGIEWHVLADGDPAGRRYVEQARGLLRGDAEDDRISMLDAPDIEHCFHEHGYAEVFRRLARVADTSVPPRRVIAKAIERGSKPMLALELVLAASRRGRRGVPTPLAGTIEKCVRLARGAG